MAIHLFWDNEAHTVLRHVYAGTISLDEFRRAVDESAARLSEVEHIVHIILDMTDMVSKANIQLLSGLSYANAHVPPNQGLLVLVTTDTFLRSLSGLVHKIAPRASRNMYFTSTLEEARQFIDLNKG